MYWHGTYNCSLAHNLVHGDAQHTTVFSNIVVPTIKVPCTALPATSYRAVYYQLVCLLHAATTPNTRQYTIQYVVTQPATS